MLIPTRRRRSSLLLAATLAAVAVVPIWQAAAEIRDDTSNNSPPSHININDETHHDDTPSWSSGGIRGLRKKKKKKNSMSRSKSHKSAKRPKAKGKKKKENVFEVDVDTDAKEKDNNNSNNNNKGKDTGTENAATCTQKQRQVCIDLDAEAGMVCTSSVCTLVEEGNFNCDTLIKDADGTTCLTYNPLNPKGTCDNGVCVGNCSAEEVAFCNRDVNSCVTKACTKREEDGNVVCGNVMSKADGTTCKPSPCKEEGTCSNGVCTGGNNLPHGTTGECGTADPDLFWLDDGQLQCCNTPDD